MHTEFDHISFYSHQTDYIAKVNANSPMPALLVHIPVYGRYGHCSFEGSEIELALNALLGVLMSP
jgi:hypothetical protein